MSRYMTNKERKLMNVQFQAMLLHNHDELLANAAIRYPETIEEVLAENPNAHNPGKIVDLNRRMNAQGERVEKLIKQIDPRF